MVKKSISRKRRSRKLKPKREPVVKNKRQADARNRALSVLSLLRREISLSQAARQVGTKPSTAKKYLGQQVRQAAIGKRWTPTQSDRLLAHMNVLTPLGPLVVPVLGSRERSRLGRYARALRRWRRGQPGADAELATFEGQRVGGQLLITDVGLLAKLEDAGQIDFEELYSSLTGGA